MKYKTQSGFTLIELTVVLLVLIALAGLAIPYMSGTSSKALCDATDVSMQNIKRVIMDRYYLDTLGYFPKDTKDTVANYNLTYLYSKPSGWGYFDLDTQLGWRKEGYLQDGINISAVPNDSFKAVNGAVHVDVTGQQPLDAWGRPIVLQVHATHGARLISAGRGSGLGLENGVLDTQISGNRAGDDRVLYLQTTPAGEDNPSCD